MEGKVHVVDALVFVHAVQLNLLVQRRNYLRQAKTVRNERLRQSETRSYDSQRQEVKTVRDERLKESAER